VGNGSRPKTRQNKKLKAFFVPSVLGTKKALRPMIFDPCGALEERAGQDLRGWKRI
jgi:hypothetical protein